ncbi:MAG: glycyl-radical enzyme activating protein [Anaerolineales bacterium]|jgi:pyruvate formate lyase activating enzyme
MKLSRASATSLHSLTEALSIEAIHTTGTVLEIQRMSTEDGPGIRTTVFLKGCPMKCPWCHNPESISPKPQIHWIALRCIGCRSCLKTCSLGALTMTDTGLEIDREVCTGCGDCAEACPSTAIELLGSEWEVDALAKELLKDREYYMQSSGGVTVSGGEAMLQWKFVSSLLQVLKDEDIHICIDTCGIARKDALDAILPYTDIVLYDLKEMDPQRHQAFTHNDIEQVLATLSYITEYIKTHSTPSEIWIRTPLIPGATARPENIRNIGANIAENCNGVVSRWDLLAFNNLCKDKYQRLGLNWAYEDTKLLSCETLAQLAETARCSGVDPEIVHWSGTTQLANDIV